MRPLRVAVYILPHKVEKLQSKGVFEVDYRHDIDLHFVDPSQPLDKQGPFDILVHKLASWYVAAHLEPEVNRQLKECVSLIQSCDTNLNFDGYLTTHNLDKKYALGMKDEETKKEDGNYSNTDGFEKSNGSTELKTNSHSEEQTSLKKKENKITTPHKMYVLDHPYAAFRTTDRWHIYNTLRNAKLEYQSKQNKGLHMHFSSPRSLLFTVEEIKEYKQFCEEIKSKNDKDIDTASLLKKHAVYQRFLELSYPVLAKSRVGVSPVNKDAEKDVQCNAHRLRIVPSPDLVIDCLEMTEDWILQEYVPHSEVHKVYVLGKHVFSTVNDSISSTTSMNSREVVHVFSRDLSKNLRQDQSGSDAFGELYQQLSENLRTIFDFNCFGYDLIVDERDATKGYILDINYLPSYKSVDNFTSLFWGFVLEQYYDFLAKKNMPNNDKPPIDT